MAVPEVFSWWCLAHTLWSRPSVVPPFAIARTWSAWLARSPQTTQKGFAFQVLLAHEAPDGWTRRRTQPAPGAWPCRRPSRTGRGAGNRRFRTRTPASCRTNGASQTIGLGEVRLHDMRHAFATRLLEANVHPKIVSEALGHASVGITLDVYSHVLPSLSRTAADAIEAPLGE
jgi:Phage integrase family